MRYIRFSEAAWQGWNVTLSGWGLIIASQFYYKNVMWERFFFLFIGLLTTWAGATSAVIYNDTLRTRRAREETRIRQL